MQKGFTLIELLAVLAILGVIAVIATISGLSILNDSKENLYKEQVETIEKAAKNYQLASPNIADNTSVSLIKLADEGYLDSSNLIDPRDNSKMCGSVKITYDETKNQYKFKFQKQDC